jgi:hypothetical protein
MNGNGKRDKGEQAAPGLKAHINGGRLKENLRDTTIVITDLEGYTEFGIEMDGAAFTQLAWQLRKKNYSVTVSPNRVKRIEVPVFVSGEVSGSVVRKGRLEDGMGGMKIIFYNEKLKVIAKTVSEIDGYFTYLGLLPGKYFVGLDTSQLDRLNLVSLVDRLPITIQMDKEGFVISGLEFVLKPKDNGVLTEDLKKAEPKIVETDRNKLVGLKEIIIPLEVGKVGDLEQIKLEIIILSKVPTGISQIAYSVKKDKNRYNIHVNAIMSAEAALELIKLLGKNGFPGAFMGPGKITN